MGNMLSGVDTSFPLNHHESVKYNWFSYGQVLIKTPQVEPYPTQDNEPYGSSLTQVYASSAYAAYAYAAQPAAA